MNDFVHFELKIKIHLCKMVTFIHGDIIDNQKTNAEKKKIKQDTKKNTNLEQSLDVFYQQASKGFLIYM